MKIHSNSCQNQHHKYIFRSFFGRPVLDAKAKKKTFFDMTSESHKPTNIFFLSVAQPPTSHAIRALCQKMFKKSSGAKNMTTRTRCGLGAIWTAQSDECARICCNVCLFCACVCVTYKMFLLSQYKETP